MHFMQVPLLGGAGHAGGWHSRNELGVQCGLASFKNVWVIVPEMSNAQVFVYYLIVHFYSATSDISH